MCSQLLSKGRKVYVEGRLATHSWTGQDGTQRTTTEVVIDDMIILDSKKKIVGEGETMSQPVVLSAPVKEMQAVKEPPSEISEDDDGKKKKKLDKTEKSKVEENNKNEEITPDDIPF